MSGNNENNCKNRMRWLDDQDVIRADVAKLHNEVNQLRNQELLVNSFAVTAVAILATVPTRDVLLSSLYLLILYSILFWQLNCLATRSIITGYLIKFGLSQWEKDYHELSSFGKQRIPSMKTATTVLFIILGVVVSSFPYFYDDSKNKCIFISLKDNEVIITSISIVVYLILIFFLPKGSLEKNKEKWGEEIKNDFEKEGPTVIQSMTISPEYANFFYKISGHDREQDLEFILRTRKQPTKTASTAPESAPPAAPPPSPASPPPPPA